jgi:hypothetical protein
MQGREYSVNEARPIQLGYEGFTETASDLSSDKASFFVGAVSMKTMIYSSILKY